MRALAPLILLVSPFFFTTLVACVRLRRSRFDANWLNYQQHSMLSDGLLDVPNVRFAFAR